MKVCFVVGTLGQGGAERQLVYMLQALLRRRITAKVFSLTKNEYFEQDIRNLGIQVEFVGEQRSRLRRLLLLVSKLKSEGADILQSSHFYTNLYAGVCGRLLGIPSVGAIRSDFVSEVNAHGLLGRWQVAAPQFLVANSMAAFSSALDSGISPERIELVRNVVASSTTNGHARSQSPVTLLFVGRLDENKRPEKFIRLADAIVRNHADVPTRFLIAGDGPRRAELQALASEFGLSDDRLTFLGSVADMGSLYGRAHILVSTSRREGSPNVILEAMAHGLSVVATRAGGSCEILADGRGLLVDPDDDRELMDSVAKLILDAKLRGDIAVEGKSYVEREHSIRYLETRLPEIYERLIRNVGSN